jgi:hypothetical protein
LPSNGTTEVVPFPINQGQERTEVSVRPGLASGVEPAFLLPSNGTTEVVPFPINQGQKRTEVSVLYGLASGAEARIPLAV